MNPLKIIVLSWEFPPFVEGGLGRHVAALTPELANQGIEIDVLIPYHKPENSPQSLQNNLTIHWVDTSVTPSGGDIYTRAETVSKVIIDYANQLWQDTGGFDLIHVHDWLMARAAITLKHAHNTPLLATIHATEQGRWRGNPLSNDLSRKIDRLEQQLAHESWRIIACSNYMVQQIQVEFALQADKLDMIPNGFDVAQQPHFSLRELRRFRKLFSPIEAPLIFSVGRMVYEKGYHVLVDAMPKILQTHPNAQLLLAGKGPYLQNLKAQAQALNIDHAVQFLGFISDLERDMFFSVADCAIFPSLYEPFGIVALEAMAFKCPLALSEVGGFAEVANHNQTATLFYANDPDSITWAVNRILNEPDLVDALTANAYLMVEEQYSWHRIALETKKIYNRILNERVTAA